MSIDEKLELLADILDVDVEEIDVNASLDEVEGWDSVAKLAFIAMMDDEFSRPVKGSEIREYQTVQDGLDAMRAE